MNNVRVGEEDETQNLVEYLTGTTTQVWLFTMESNLINYQSLSQKYTINFDALIFKSFETFEIYTMSILILICI